MALSLELVPEDPEGGNAVIIPSLPKPSELASVVKELASFSEGLQVTEVGFQKGSGRQGAGQVATHSGRSSLRKGMGHLACIYLWVYSLSPSLRSQS